jgi:hypothetical protein
MSSNWLQVRLGCIRLSPSCPFRLLHTFLLSRPARRYPRFRIQRPSSERRGDFNPHDSCAAQRTLWPHPTPHPRTCPSFGCCLHEPVRHFMSDTNEVSQVPCKDRLRVLKVSDCARFIPRKRLTHVMMLLSGQRNGVSTSQFDPFRSSMLGPWSPCERFTLILADSPCITRGRGGWLGLISWKTCTSYSLPASWRSVSGHPEPVTSAGRNVRFDRLK